jgi:hypothetical protein
MMSAELIVKMPMIRVCLWRALRAIACAQAGFIAFSQYPLDKSAILLNCHEWAA